jgi:hypothetical protein
MSVQAKDRTLIRIIMTDMILKIDHSKTLKDLQRNNPINYEIFISDWTNFIRYGTIFLVSPSEENRTLAFKWAEQIIKSPLASYSLRDLFSTLEKRDNLFNKELASIEQYIPNKEVQNEI